MRSLSDHKTYLERGGEIKLEWNFLLPSDLKSQVFCKYTKHNVYVRIGYLIQRSAMFACVFYVPSEWRPSYLSVCTAAILILFE